MFLKRQLPVYIMVTIGIMTLLGHFIKGGFVETFIKEDSISWFNIIASFSLILGAFNLLKIHIQKAANKQKDWQYSLIALFGFFIMIFAGFLFRGANYISIEINDKNINQFIISEDGRYFVNENLVDEINQQFQEKLVTKCYDDNGLELQGYSVDVQCYANNGQWIKSNVDPSEFNRPIYDFNGGVLEDGFVSEIKWMIYDYLEQKEKIENYQKIYDSDISLYDLKIYFNDYLIGGNKVELPINDDCFDMHIDSQGGPILFERNGYCDEGSQKDIEVAIQNFPEWRVFEKFEDHNGNGKIDIGGKNSGNGVWNATEEFTDDNKNCIQDTVNGFFWDYEEKFTDSNDNGRWDISEPFIDAPDGVWYPGEKFIDSNYNGRWDLGEDFTDSNGNCKCDIPEGFTDSNENGQYDLGEPFEDTKGNGVYDTPEEFVDKGNGIYNFGEEFVDLNYNKFYDLGEFFIDQGNGIWDDGEKYFDVNSNGKYDSGDTFTDIGSVTVNERDSIATNHILITTTVPGLSINKDFKDSLIVKSNLKQLKFRDVYTIDTNIVISKDFNRKHFSYNSLAENIKSINSAVPGFISIKSVDWGKHVEEDGTFIKWLFDSAYSPIDMTMFALLAFFVASASYRAFRIRNFEASLLLIAGVLVMLGAIPVGMLIPSWFFAYMFLFIIFAFLAPLFKNKQIFTYALLGGSILLLSVIFLIDISFLNAKSIMTWIIKVPTVAGKKAIMIGVALGIVGTSLRIIFGRDKSFLGD